MIYLGTAIGKYISIHQPLNLPLNEIVWMRQITLKGGKDLPKWTFFTFNPKFLCYGPIEDFWSKTLYSFCENKTPNRPNYFLDFTIIRAKKKLSLSLYMGIKTYQEKNTKP